MSGGDADLRASQRVDSLIVDPATGSHRHRSDYAGTIWFGGQPQITGANALPGASETIEQAIPLPDSHPYVADRVSAAVVQASGALLSARATSAGGSAQLMDLDAVLESDSERPGSARVVLRVGAVAMLPLGISYRVIVISDPEAVTPASG